MPRVRFERCRIGDRYDILDTARRLEVNWPHEFVRTCRGARVTASNISEQLDKVPHWLSNAVRWNLADGHYAPNELERESVRAHLLRAKQPASRNAVNQLLGVSHVA